MRDLANRPHVTIVLAASADGKIGDRLRSPARFGSARDRDRLEREVAGADGVLMGAETLRSMGTTLRVKDPQLLGERDRLGKSPQPVHAICSYSGRIDPSLPFFRQPVPRWLLTVPAPDRPVPAGFDRVVTVPERDRAIDWPAAANRLKAEGIDRLAVLGGGEVVAALLAEALADELCLTICPLILGGKEAPTPADGFGFQEKNAPRLQLLACEAIEGEVFLRYRFARHALSSGTGSV